MAADNILGKLLIEGANQAANIAGGNPSLGSGLAGGGGGTGTRSAERETRSFQKTVKDAQIKSVAFAKNQPQWWTRMFKTLGIQMGLAGILKQSQVFTSTVGAFFQIFGAMVDVMLAPLVKPVLIPVMRWLARQIPTMGKLSRAVFGFLGSTVLGLVSMVKKIGGWLSNLGKKEFWVDLKNSIVNTINGIPGRVMDTIKTGLTWDYWKNIFRALWNATVGGRGLGMGINIPEWGGMSSTPTATQQANNAAYEASIGEGIHSDTPSTYSGANDPNLINTTTVWGPTGRSTIAPMLEGGHGGPSATETKASVSSHQKGPGTTPTAGGGGFSIKDMFNDLNLLMKTAVAGTGVSMTAVLAAKLKNLLTGGLDKVLKLGFAPGKVALGIIRLFAQQFNPTSSEAFIGQLMRGVPKNEAWKKALGSWGANMKKDLGFGGGGGNPAMIADEALPTTPRDSGLVDKRGNPLKSTLDDDMAPGGTSKLTKVRIRIMQFTSWVKEQLRNLKTVVKNAVAVIAKVTKDAADIIKEINLLPGARDSAAKVGMRATVTMLRDALKRAIPVVGAAVGVAETVYGVKRILGSDLGWVVPHENTEAAMQTLGKITGIQNLRQGFADEPHTDRHWANPIGWGEGFLRSQAQGAMTQSEIATAVGSYMNQTKGGNIFTQLALGGISTGAGFVGAPGIPISMASSTAQMTALFGALGDQNRQQQGLTMDLWAAYTAGVQSTQKQVNITVDGNPAVLDVPW